MLCQAHRALIGKARPQFGLVNGLQTMAFESVNVDERALRAGMPTPKFDPSDEVAKVDQEFSAIVKQAEELSSHSEKRIKELKSELAGVQAEKVRLGLCTVGCRPSLASPDA